MKYLFVSFASLFLSCSTQTQQLKFVPAPGSPYNVGQSGDLTLTDVNKDGKQDIVTVNGKDSRLTILFGDGKGSFTAATPSPVTIGPSAHEMKAGDINKDGNVDFVLTEHDSYNISVLLGDSKMEFTHAHGSPFPSIKNEKAHNHGLILVDLNKDSNLDIAVSNHGNGSVSVFLGNGTGGFNEASGSPFKVGKGPYPLASGDVNNDGNPDIVTPDMLNNSVSVLLGDGSGSFKNASSVTVQERPYNMEIGDINNDGNADLLVSHDDINTVTILLGNGKGSFASSSASPLDMGHRSYKMVLIDLNNDKQLDLVTNSYPKYITLMLGDGKGGFKHADNSPLEAGNSPNAVTVEHINGDNKYDLVFVNSQDNTVSVLLGE